MMTHISRSLLKCVYVMTKIEKSEAPWHFLSMMYIIELHKITSEQSFILFLNKEVSRQLILVFSRIECILKPYCKHGPFGPYLFFAFLKQKTT